MRWFDFYGERYNRFIRLILDDKCSVLVCFIKYIFSSQRACIDTWDINRSCIVGIDDTIVLDILDAIPVIEITEIRIRKLELFILRFALIELDIGNAFHRQHYLEEGSILYDIPEFYHRNVCCEAQMYGYLIFISLIYLYLACLRIYGCYLVALVIVETDIVSYREYSSGDDCLFR